jgi:ribose 5-phosphate isomerase B
MTVYFATDHAGFALKEVLLTYVRDELGYAVEDCGAFVYTEGDDYPDYISLASKKVSENPAGARAIILGGSGQGEAMVANKYKGVRAAVYYGPTPQPQIDASGNELSMIESVRAHNDANILSLGVRFITEEEAKRVVQTWLSTPFSEDGRHMRRIAKF